MQQPLDKTEQDVSNQMNQSRRSLLRRTVAGSTALTLGIASFGSSAAAARSSTSNRQARSPFSVQTLSNSGLDIGDGLGATIEVSANGRTALVSAPYSSFSNSTSSDGVYVFTKTNDEWEHTDTLPNPLNYRFFGNELALSGNGKTALVGVPTAYTGDSNQAGPGKVYVFTRTATGWTQTTIFSDPESDEDNRFGTVVELSTNGQTALIGASRTRTEGTPEGFGKAYEFTLTEREWNHTGTIRSPSDINIGFLRSAVALSADGQTVLIGATVPDSELGGFVGEVYVFRREASGWVQTDTLSNPNPTPHEYFSDAIALSADGETALIAAPYDNTSDMFGVGEAYVFTKTSSGWTHTDTLSNPEPTQYDLFGNSVALSRNGRTALIGTPGDDTANSSEVGEVYMFTRSSSGWTYTQTFSNPDPDKGDSFGSSVALDASGQTAFIGAPGNDTATNTNVGEVYVLSANKNPNRHRRT